MHHHGNPNDYRHWTLQAASQISFYTQCRECPKSATPCHIVLMCQFVNACISLVLDHDNLDIDRCDNKVCISVKIIAFMDHDTVILFHL